MTADTATPTLPEALTGRGVSRDAVEALAQLCDDTPWLRDQRMQAWDTFERLPMPTRSDEHWRFTNLRRVDIGSVAPFTARGESAAPAAPSPDSEVAAHVVHRNSQVDDATLPAAGSLPAGVVVTSLARAQREHAPLLERYFGSAVPVGDTVDDKFVALQQATIADGLFVYVPRGVRVELPIRVDVLHGEPGGTLNWRALVVVDEGAEATFVEEFTSAQPSLEGFSNAVVELVAEPASTVHYVTVQNLASPVRHFATHRVVARRDATVDWAAVGLGAALGKSRMEAILAGDGASVRLSGAYFLAGRQELDYDTRQLHERPNTMSDLSFRGALDGSSRVVWRGTIDVADGAQGTDAYQENRNLLLSRTAHADSVPGLQIEANEVRCTHGSTTGSVDAEQLFYLQSRGMPAEQARREIVRGFFMPALDRIGSQVVRDHVRDAIWQRMG